jgi:hypothetical protein
MKGKKERRKREEKRQMNREDKPVQYPDQVEQHSGIDSRVEALVDAKK